LLPLYFLGRNGRASRAFLSLLILLIKWAQMATNVFLFGDVYILSKRWIRVREDLSFCLRMA